MSTENLATPGRRPAAPSVTELLDALERLPAGTPRRVALMHLVTPASVVGGIGVEFSGGRYSYRGFARAANGDDAVTIAGDLLAVVHAGHRPTDTYLDLTGSPTGWVKVLRSGFRQVAFGTDLLFGAPLVQIAADVPAGAAAQLAAGVVEQWQAGTLHDGMQLTAAGRSVRASVGEDVVALHSERTAAETPAPWSDPRGAAVHAATVGTSLATLLGAEDMELSTVGSRMAGSTDFEVALALPGGWSAVVPVTVAPGAELIGVDTDQVLASPEETMPEGFTWCGRALWADATVGWHRRAEVAALLTRVPTTA